QGEGEVGHRLVAEVHSAQEGVERHRVGRAGHGGPGETSGGPRPPDRVGDEYAVGVGAAHGNSSVPEEVARRTAANRPARQQRPTASNTACRETCPYHGPASRRGVCFPSPYAVRVSFFASFATSTMRLHPRRCGGAPSLPHDNSVRFLLGVEGLYARAGE